MAVLKPPQKRGLIITAAIIVALVYGYFVGEKHIFPYSVIAAVGEIFEEPWEPYVKVADHYYETDVAALIGIESETDILARRSQLTLLIWGAGGLPTAALPTRVEQDITDERWADADNLARIDRLTTELDWGLDDIIYHFIPEQVNGKLLLYQQGHRGDFIIGERTVRFFLKAGYAVMGMAMPMKGLNNQPVVQLPRYGRFKIEDHKHLILIPPDEGHQVKYFLDPIARAVNYALETYSYDEVNIIGISGGGWTTTLYAALDTRIARSYPVAGTYPFFLRSDANSGTWGDWEQTVQDVYLIANYPELYIMGSYGEGRRQLQIINQFDTCCFYGFHFQTYEEFITRKVQELGPGAFSVYLDDSHKSHQISVPVLEAVLADLNRP